MSRCTLLFKIFAISCKNAVSVPGSQQEGGVDSDEDDKQTECLEVNHERHPQKESGEKDQKSSSGGSANGNKAFSCHVCTYRTNRPSHLSRHMRKHTGERPFSCPICKKSFTRKDHSNTHQGLHYSAAILTCSTCGKGFARRQYLLAHQNVHRNDINTCTICGARYKWRKSLQRHVKDKHQPTS